MPYKAECGVYSITNMNNNKQYVGASANMRNRWAVHKHYLERCTHKNPFMQDDCSRYGVDVFVFEILEHAERDNLLAREQFYIDLLKPAYNVYTSGDDKKRLVPRSEESIQKIRITRKGMKPSLETRAKMSTARKGRKFTEEHKARLSAANKTSEAHKRFSETMAQRVYTDESRQRMTNANIKAWSNPESYERREKVRQVGLANRGRKASPETRARQSEAQKRRHEKAV